MVSQKDRYVDGSMLRHILRENRFPTEIQLSPATYLTFGSHGLTLTRVYSSTNTRTKYVGNWKEKSVEELNQELILQEYV